MVEEICDSATCFEQIFALDNIPELKNKPVTTALVSIVIEMSYQNEQSFKVPFVVCNLPLGNLNIKYGTMFFDNDGRTAELLLAFNSKDKPVYIIVREFKHGVLDEDSIYYVMFEQHTIEHNLLLESILKLPIPKVTPNKDINTLH